MANRYDIIHIDFQASARGANAAIESIRQEADKCNTRITELKKNIAEAPKNGTDAKIVEDWNQELKVTDRKYRQLIQAQKELMKGMRALDEGVKMFNDGSLSAMNAAFQKQVNNAAKLAQSKLAVGSKEWRDMGAIMQETEQNYARMQRDTDQLIDSLQNGGAVFRKTLEDEKKGLQDLLQVLPYMGTEYRKASDQLDFLTKKTEEMSIKERQLKGEIVTTDDARRVSLQLTKEGAEAARQRAEAADAEIEKGKKVIEALEKEREERESSARASAQAAAEYRENQQMYEDEIARLQKEIKAEEERAASGKTGVEAMYRKAEAAGKAADKEVEAQKKLDGEYEVAKGKVAALREEYEKMKQAAGSAAVKDAAASVEKSGAEESVEASKKKTEAKKEETTATKEATAAKKEETLSENELVAALKSNKAVIDSLYKERDELIKKQKEGAEATREETNAFKDLSREQAEAMLKQKQALTTIAKGNDGKMSYTNAEEAQRFLIESMRSVNPANAKGGALSLDSDGVAKVRAMFKERYGIQDDADALAAIKGLISGENGGLIKGGMMNNAFSRIDLNTQKVAEYNKEIKDLTAVINGETKAVEKNVEQKRTLADVDAEIEAKEKEQRENAVLLIKMRNGLGDTASGLVKKNEELTDSHKKNTEAIKTEIEAIKQMNREQAEAKKKEMTATSTIGWKAGKLDASNLEEAQHYLLTQISKMGTAGKDGTYTLAGQNIDKLLTAFHNKYGEKGKLQESKALLKELVSGKSGGLFNEGGVVDFSSETLMIKANTEAYQGRLDKLKALISITNGTAQAVKKSTDAVNEDTKATNSQTDAYKNQEQEVERLRKAYEAAKKEHDEMKSKLSGLRTKKSSLPNSGPDAGFERQQLTEEITDYHENVVKPKGREVTKLKNQWQKEALKLAQMQAETIAENSQAEDRNTEATERNTKAKGGKKKAADEAAKATGEETQKSAELLAKEKELKDAEDAEAEALKNKEAQQKKTNDAIEKAEAAADKAKKSEADLVKSLDEKGKKLEENKANLEALNKANEKTIADNEKNQKLLADTNAKIQEQGDKIRDAELIKAQAKTEGIEKTEQAIRLLTEENRHIDTNSKTWKENTVEIQHLQEALDEMKGKPALMMMEKRMENIGHLSASAVAETRRFWETMAAGAEKGSDKLAQAEAHVKTLAEEERKRSEAQAGEVIGNMGAYSDKEIADAVKTFEQLRDAQTHGNDEWRKFNELAQQGKQHLEELAKTDALTKMEANMSNLNALSESALAETKKYWETMVAETERGDDKLATYEAHLKDVKEQEQARQQIINGQKAGIVRGESFNVYSLDEIRESIAAAKELHSHMASASPEAMRLAESIAKAEEHVKKYGGEAARTAQANETMRQQFATMANDMSRGIMPPASAVKAQQNYWKKLIEDPKTAKESLQEYRDQLAEVEKMQEAMVKISGETAYQWFQNGSYKDASTNKVKEMAADLKAYRDSLPQETEAAKIQQIDQWLQKAGASAKKATQELMDFEDAELLAMEAGEDIYGQKGPAFMASPEEIQAATKSIEKYREELFKTIKAKRDNGEATDAEEQELKELAQYLKDLKFEQDNFNMSREKMETLMETPVSAANLDELRAAIKRADGELHRMEGSLSKNSEEYKIFAEKVRDAKNQLKEMEGAAKASATQWEKAWSRLKTYVGLYMGFNILWQKMTGTFGDMMELSDKMGEVRKTTGFTADEVGRLSDNLSKLDVRTPLTQLMDIAAKAGQLGLKTEQDVMGFTEAANKLMIALPEMGTEAATEMMKVALATGEVAKIQDQINKGLVEGSSATEVALSKVGSVIDQLRANSAAAAPQITDFVKRVGAVGAQSGITIDQVAALGATVDAIGLRVEMSATALSRMIPAIRNNAFEVAKAIGMTPQALREMFDEAGGGMEAMLAIFQHIKDAGLDPDSIEKMLGMGGMQDVMKQLNQQGARAGIVFAGLSQNVDELRRNLGTAKEAYEDNIAILQEYNKMNDTTAAKWERLKNQIEEAIVSDTMQRLLGYVVTGLRTIVDLLTSNSGVSAAIRTILAYVGMLKLNLYGIVTSIHATGGGLKGILITLGLIDKETKKIQWGNIFTAAAAAIAWVVLELSNLKSALDKAQESLGKTKEEVGRAIDRFEAYWAKLNSTSEALQKAKASHEKLSVEVDKLRKTTDGSAESTANLKKKEDELEQSEKNVTKASNDHKSAIAQMNSIYGKYLGFILTEANYANLAAAAHDKVTAAIEREMYMKQKQSAIGEVDSNYAQDIATGYGELNERLVQYGKLSRSEAAKAMADMQKFMRENLKYDAAKNTTVVSQAVTDMLKKGKLDVSKATANEIAGLWFDQYLKDNYHMSDKVRRGITGVERRSDMTEGWANVYTPGATNLRGDYGKTFAEREKSRGAVSLVYDADINRSLGDEAAASKILLENLEKSAQDAKKTILDKNVDEKKRNEAYGELANALEGLDNRIKELDPKQDAATISHLEGMAKALKGEGIDIKKLKQAREKIHQTLFEKATFNEEDIRNLDTTNPWGGSHDAASTDWANMTAEQLVERRKQMKNFVNSIQTDSDVKAVLGEDAALQAAIRKGMSSDMRTVIEWYNTERLKIQDELYKRHLTNTGDWRDPKKSKESWRKQLQMDLDNYLKMLDAYYTKRKAEIQEAGNDEGLTEAEIRNRQLANDTEWQQRRMELQQIYLGKREKVAKDEVTAIMAILAEMDEDTPEMVGKLIGKSLDKWKILEEKAPEMARRLESKFVSGVSASMLKMQQIVAQQMKAIQDIIDKERPFNGITKSLTENLQTMDILTADMREEYRQLMKEGKDTSDFNRRQAEEEVKRTTFLLGEAENAYSTTVEEVMARMADAGMEAWAEELRQSPQMQEALMAQLHQTYDAIQEAIKKEASLMKKQAETMWNNILLPGGDGKTTVKDAFEQAVAQLGIDQGRVSRANSLIGAGQASERVADRLAIKQMQLQLSMQEHYYNLMRKQGMQRIKDLERQVELAREEGDIEKAKRIEMDRQHVEMSLRLATTKEQNELLKQQEEIIAKTEESENRLYTQLKEWGDLLASSMRELMEASNAGNAEYYNELAKLNLTGKGGPGAGTYIVIDNEGTSDAKAHYEYLDERAALERQREIEQQNAQAEAWRKVMDDLNAKMNEQITDWMNAQLQNQAVYENTDALGLNTKALGTLSEQLAQGITVNNGGGNMGVDASGVPNALKAPEASGQEGYGAPWMQPQAAEQPAEGEWVSPLMPAESVPDYENSAWAKYAENRALAAESVLDSQKKEMQGQKQTEQQMTKSSQATFAKMTLAANMYGVAYQAVSNENLSATQKFEMIALQAVGNYAISSLTTFMSEAVAKGAVDEATVLGKLWSQLGWAAAPVFAIFTGLLGAAMGAATSAVSKSKSQIAQATGASASAGKLTTGMLAYAEGNVNEFTNPDTLTPGRQYNVDAADGRTYRARYMGSNPKTHLTNGPEFHLSGERGREMIIDAGTTRQITMNDGEIWHAIQTLSAGGRLPASRRRRGVRAFAEGNVDDFEEMAGGYDMPEGSAGGFSPEMAAQMQASLDRNSEVMERVLEQGIHAYFDVYGKGGLVDSYDTGKKTVTRHGERY